MSYGANKVYALIELRKISILGFTARASHLKVCDENEIYKYKNDGYFKQVLLEGSEHER